MASLDALESLHGSEMMGEEPVVPRVHLNMVVHQSLVGSIIGKGGEIINSIREKSGAKVIISEAPNGSDERDVLVKGSEESVRMAVELIMQRMEDENAGDFSVSMKVLVPNELAGALIGTGGENIQRMRKTYDCKIEIFEKRQGLVHNRMWRSQMKFRIARATGPPSQVQGVMLEIVQIAAERCVSGDDVCNSYHQERAHHLGPVPPMQPFQYQNMAMYHTPSPAGRGGYFPGGGLHGAAPVEMEAYTYKLSIPNANIGQVIGKRGTTIHWIRNVTGCRIDISKLTEGYEYREVTITGTPQQVDHAKMLIHSKVKV
mmetsp:Transcript_18166/g.51236  ORF Transcript_18166/g.51236 Transcript_18166/m.51236 type:complete len:316 (+) Transcript_18166:289-1236(+)|eukprot:CAMPEP_0119131116 /NCGR_PEP_ID=MMETSP1310-20130426/9493_1 /TAXON_ID=464262 /ORGANISM="Genus nov. species nov., Strain RCC2339" /LENGTH=315 /DNA_ID=CAMNT_0007121669 /DNA_START=250 /DNA_END=1197 /DNA_ORIENTATION=-